MKVELAALGCTEPLLSRGLGNANGPDEFDEIQGLAARLASELVA
jgi:hypothetical protein